MSYHLTARSHQQAIELDTSLFITISKNMMTWWHHWKQLTRSSRHQTIGLCTYCLCHADVEAETKWRLFCRKHFHIDFLYENCCMSIKLNWNLFPNNLLTVTQLWFRKDGTKQVTSRYLNQPHPRTLIYVFVTRPQWVNGYYLLILLLCSWIMQPLNNNNLILCQYDLFRW